MKRIIWVLLAQMQFLLLAVGFHATVVAQLRIVKGDHFPADPSENTWFHSTTTVDLWSFSAGKWVHMAAYPVDTVCACGQFALFKSSTVRVGMGYRHASIWDLTSKKYWCGEVVVMTLNDEGEMYFYDGNRNILAHVDTNECSVSTTPSHIGGMDAFCVPRYVESFRHRHCSTFRTWGILGTNAQWLIEPKFDAPFEFQNGVAEVIYYGQRRKINEKGEWVE